MVDSSSPPRYQTEFGNDFTPLVTKLQFGNDLLTAMGLFVLALIPRILSLSKFITADEPRWAVRSMDFLRGLLTANWQATLQTGHPGVTTM